MKLQGILFAAAISLLVIGCSSDSSGGTAPKESGTTMDKAPGGTTGSTAQGEGSGASLVAFAPVNDILSSRCTGCHGDQNPKEGLSLTSYDGVMKGGEHGPVVKPGAPGDSLIIKMIKGEGGKRMPPKGDPLTPEQIKTVEDWIADGAKK